MPAFQKNALRTPFGGNNYLRSTDDVSTESHTVSAASVPSETIDGVAQKLLLKGELLAKITSGPATGMVGPYQPGTEAAVAAEVQTVGLGAASAGTVTLAIYGETTAAIAYNATKATVQAALNVLSNVDEEHTITVGGADFPGVMTFTFGGADWDDINQPAIVVTPTGLTGGTVAVLEATPGSGETYTSPATDGRQDPANIVGFNNTFLPWQLLVRDVEVAVAYDCNVVQANCTERNAAGARVPLSDETAEHMVARKDLSVVFK